MHSIDTEREAATFLWELKTEIDACRRQVHSLTDELCAQQVKFAAYKASTEAQLSELRKHKRTAALGREVPALRSKADEAGNGPKTAAATRREETAEAPARDAEDRSAAPDGIPSETEDDGKTGAAGVCIKSEPAGDETIESSRNVKEECDAAMQTEGPTGDARPGTPDTPRSTAGPTDSTPKRANLTRKSGPSKKVSGPDAAGDRALQKDRVMWQRVLLLHHASRCTAPAGTCRVSRHCAATKAVLNHVLKDGCTDPNCGVEHCASSRYVLRNYRRWCAAPLSRGAVCRRVKSSNSV